MKRAAILGVHTLNCCLEDSQKIAFACNTKGFDEARCVTNAIVTHSGALEAGLEHKLGVYMQNIWRILGDFGC